MNKERFSKLAYGGYKKISRLNEQIAELEKTLEREEIIDANEIKEKMQNLEKNIKKLNEESENSRQKLN